MHFDETRVKEKLCLTGLPSHPHLPSYLGMGLEVAIQSESHSQKGHTGDLVQGDTVVVEQRLDSHTPQNGSRFSPSPFRPYQSIAPQSILYHH